VNPLINPFIRSGTHPEQAIVDRRRASRLFSPLVAEGGALNVYGERYMGKSLMLQYIAEPPNDWREAHFQNYIFAFFNCQDTVIPFTANNFWTQATKTLERKTEDSPIKEKCQALLARIEEGAELGANDFHDILDVAAGAGKRIVLVLDDFDALIRTDTENLDSSRTFLQGLRSLTTRDSNKANLVIATRYSLQELCKPLAVQGMSPFENGFASYRLQRFRDNDILRLLQRVEQTEQTSFIPLETRYVIYLSGYHPHLAQIAAAEIFDQRIESGFPLRDLTPVGERFKVEARSVFESLWEGASEIERMLLMLIALQDFEGEITDAQYSLSDLSNIFSQRERELDELTERGLLNRTQTNPPAWGIFSPIFQWWIIKEIESSPPEQLSERRKVWGNLVTQKQADKLGKTVELVKNNKQLIEKVGRSVLKLTGVELPPLLGGG